MQTPEPRLLADIRDLLEQENQSLLDGDLARIESILHRKLKLIDRLGGNMMASLPSTNELRTTVLKNQALLDEALRGIKSIQDRVVELDRARSQFDTYDINGRRQSVKSGPPTIERRA